jgi:hypothetical protein
MQSVTAHKPSHVHPLHGAWADGALPAEVVCRMRMDRATATVRLYGPPGAPDRKFGRVKACASCLDNRSMRRHVSSPLHPAGTLYGIRDYGRNQWHKIRSRLILLVLQPVFVPLTVLCSTEDDVGVGMARVVGIGVLMPYSRCTSLPPRPFRMLMRSPSARLVS